jgi:hypothetical protein
VVDSRARVKTSRPVPALLPPVPKTLLKSLSGKDFEFYLWLAPKIVARLMQ